MKKEALHFALARTVRVVCEYEQDCIDQLLPAKWWEGREERTDTYLTEAGVPSHSPKMWRQDDKLLIYRLAEKSLKEVEERMRACDVKATRGMVEIQVIMRAQPTEYYFSK